MYHRESSVASSSPFSTRSTIPSSPDAAGIGESSSSAGRKNGYPNLAGFPDYLTGGGQDLMHGMEAMLGQITGARTKNGTSYPSYPSTDGRSHSDIQPTNVVDLQPYNSIPPPLSSAPPTLVSKLTVSAAPSVSGGGSRSEPPRRLIEVEGLSASSPPLEKLLSTFPCNQIILQGDPQVIQKQRVETAIRVILDLLRLIPPSPSNPPVHPSLASLLPRDPNGHVIGSFERIATFKALRLQAGTTTKASSKKQIQAGATPREQLAYVETAVYMSGENGKRVYACKRCRLREARRRQSKDASRKKQSNSESDTSSSNQKPRVSLVPPSPEYVTAENPEQYDTNRAGQVVEEPPWDPARPDWRHEIVLFNSPPEIAIKDGSCYWLPFRVVCYGKCHGEKVGFRIKFTLRSFDGRVIASEMTPPIRITDDHKTDAKAKPKVDAPAVPRARKGRQSTTSSRQSPVQSEDELSVHSFSEAGAILHKQAPQARAGKPYERPPSQSPATGHIPIDAFATLERPIFNRQQSASSVHSMTSIHSMTSLSALSAQQDMVDRWSRATSLDYANQDHAAGTVSPGALKRPHFRGLTSMDSMQPTPSGLPSPMSRLGLLNPQDDLRSQTTRDDIRIQGKDDLMYLQESSPAVSMSALGFSFFGNDSSSNPTNVQQQQLPMLSGNDDIEMSNALEDIYSQQPSAPSSLTDDMSSYSDQYVSSSALFSDSGLPPDGFDQYLNYTGEAVEPRAMTSPFATNNFNNLSPLSHMPNALDSVENLLWPSTDTHHVPEDPSFGFDTTNIPFQAPPTITHVIPGEGSMAGGIPIAIAGKNFASDTVVLFGQRPARTTVVSDGFLDCTLPPSSFAGDVEVTVRGAQKVVGVPPMLFKYTDMDKEMMRLALQVRDQYQNSSSDAAYRLAQHVTRSHSNSEWSEKSSPVSNPSPTDAGEPGPEARSKTRGAADSTDLQETIITFLASLEEDAPGSLRRSGVINHRNKSQQTLLHIATVMGFHRLARRLIVVGAHLDLQDSNGFTPLSFAALCGHVNCARVLLEAGASYDVPTHFGEMPLDLSKAGEFGKVEALLLSAVWSTKPEVAGEETASVVSIETNANSEIDNDNPSSDSDDQVSRILRRSSQQRRTKKGKAKGKTLSPGGSPGASESAGRSPSTSNAHLPLPTPSDDPPPYAPSEESSWVSHLPLPHAVLDRLPMIPFPGEKTQPNWVAFPAPSWETLQKMTSPEEVKLFTQAMAAAAFNAVVQSGATTGQDQPREKRRGKSKRRKSQSGNSGVAKSDSSSPSPVKQVKRECLPYEKELMLRVGRFAEDRMLYLFWLPVLLFVGFWLLVTALPIATGFCLIYARQITRAIKQRM
ncbi:hypothetical protein P7C73_g204, partial [Tremellales sp. Uapishka_1]